jgi:phosphate transport system permease protein
MTSGESAVAGAAGTAAPGPRGPGTPRGLTLSRARRVREGAIRAILLTCGALSILTTVGIVVVLVVESVGFFTEVSIREFLTGTTWTPLFRPQQFGVLPLVAGSVLVAVGASIIALPVGTASAIYLAEYAPERARRVLKPVLEILAGIPTVVYGYFALTFITPIIRGIFPETGVFNAASAAIVVGIMIIPMVASLSEDAIRAVPLQLREAAYGLGATRFEVVTRVVVPASLSGILASFILAISRAIGETMAVTLAAGATPKMTLNPLESIQTMTAYIVQVSLGDTPFGTIEYKTIFAVALLLFVITLGMNVLSNVVLARYREVYE